MLSYPSVVKFVLGAQKNRLNETALLCIHNICFGWEVRNIIFNYALLHASRSLHRCAYVTVRPLHHRHSEYRDKGEGQKAQSQLQMTRQNDITVETDLVTFLSAFFS